MGQHDSAVFLFITAATPPPLTLIKVNFHPSHLNLRQMPWVWLLEKKTSLAMRRVQTLFSAGLMLTNRRFSLAFQFLQALAPLLFVAEHPFEHGKKQNDSYQPVESIPRLQDNRHPDAPWFEGCPPTPANKTAVEGNHLKKESC
jgi:hypothetical protein